LLLASAGADRLQLTLLKRRGPPLARPLTLALTPVLARAVPAAGSGVAGAGQADRDRSDGQEALSALPAAR
ncbi:MAG: hypothetical protein KGN16_19525, partial [Burkholderiales bacterium]|nr:hypothetical protein [Burkholderiales bacterium]